MARAIRETEQSRKDAQQIWDYIAYGVPSSADLVSADRVLDAILLTYRALADFPHKTRVEEDRDIFRVTVEGFPKYLILYRFDDEQVEILRVFRGDLDWNRIVKEL